MLVNGGPSVKTCRVSSDQTAARVLALLKRYGREATSFQVLTTLQVLLWNVWTARTPLAWTLMLLGCTGPLLASLFFRRARLLAMDGGIRGHVPGRP